MRLVAVIIGVVVTALVLVMGAAGALGGDKTLTVSVSAGKGTITGGADSATDVSCDEAGGDCTEPYSQTCDPDDPEVCSYPEVELTATPKFGFAFSSWTGSSAGACDTTAGPNTCTLSMALNRTVSANFADVQAPGVGFTSPGDFAKVRGTITVAAAAGDNAGVRHVSFSIGNPPSPFATVWSPPYQTSLDTTTLPDGPWTLTATARDTSGNATSVPRGITIDNTAPSVAITAGPAEGSYTNSSSVSFTYSASDAMSGVRETTCARDTQDPLDYFCDTSTSQAYTGLADGQHTFVVAARDWANNVAFTPARHWTVDTAAPTVSITGGPSVGSISKPSGTFTFSASDANGVAARACKLDGAAFGACTSTTTFNFSGLGDGDHTFTVRATDVAGNVQSTSRSWKVDSHAPTVSAPTTSLSTATPISPTNGNLPVVVSWAAATDVVSSGVASYTLFESVNGGAFGAVGTFAPANRTTTRFVAPGSTYRWRLRATDNVGNSGDSTPTALVSATGIQDGDPAVTYVKPWLAYPHPYLWGGSMKAANAIGASATFHVPAGARAIALVALKGASVASVGVSVDGGPSTTVDLYAASWQVRQLVFARGGLSLATHTVTVTRLGATGFVDVDGLVVLR